MVVAIRSCKPSPFWGKLPPPFHFGPVQPPRISAIFWGPKNVTEQQELDFTLGNFTLTSSGSEDISGNGEKHKVISLSRLSSISEVSSGDWDACTLDATGPEKYNPFLTHGFLSSLEDHSYGEFIFDHSWADAYYNFGSRYYPKLQCCIHFTLSRLSSLHITFPLENNLQKLSEKGFSKRIGMQYHWKNRTIKGEKCIRNYLIMLPLCITLYPLGFLYKFYKNTTNNKWGTPYLNRDFFHIMASKMGDQVLLVVAEEGDEPVVGALNLIGGDALFGRLWGLELHTPSCHVKNIVNCDKKHRVQLIMSYLIVIFPFGSRAS
ncbi:hypothetical protein UlMin_027174 [Ulmus minor]